MVITAGAYLVTIPLSAHWVETPHYVSISEHDSHSISPYFPPSTGARAEQVHYTCNSSYIVVRDVAEEGEVLKRISSR